jgi:hypothetical protein
MGVALTSERGAMKKLIVAIAVLGICISLPQAQANSLTLRPMIGYGIGTGKMVSGSDQVWTASATTKNENMYYSGGAGIKIGLGLDADVAEHIALGFDVGYSMGLSAEMDKSAGPDYTDKTEVKTSYVPVSVTLKVRSKLEKITVFAGFGPTLLMLPKATMKYDETDGTDVTAIEAETTLKMGLGYHGLAGIEYGLTDKMSFIVQLRSDQVSVKMDKSKVTKATYNGTDMLADWTTRDKETTYLEDDTTDAPTNESIPMIEKTEMFPANSLAISFGIGISF